jgi:3-oxoacyl-[acyl-carrier protein] reductase
MGEIMTTAMIWGAGGGIGQALTTQLLSNDWDVITIGRDVEQLDNRSTLAVDADVTNAFSVQNAILSAGYEFDEVALWIYAAGDITSSSVKEMTPENWQRILDANLTGAFLTTHFSLPLLAEDAYMIYLGAVSERLRLPGLSAYAAAKSGLEAFAESLRKEERKRRVMVVRPGAVATPFWDKVPMRLPKDAASPEKVAKRILNAYLEGFTGVLDLT